jgi:hypothetical protein
MGSIFLPRFEVEAISLLNVMIVLLRIADPQETFRGAIPPLALRKPKLQASTHATTKSNNNHVYHKSVK